MTPAPQTAPYGAWRSPITADLIAGGRIGVSSPRLDGDDIYWIESRPEEAGRSVIVRYVNMLQMSDEDLRSAIKFEADKYIPFDIDEVQLDCVRLEGADAGGGAGGTREGGGPVWGRGRRERAGGVAAAPGLAAAVRGFLGV